MDSQEIQVGPVSVSLIAQDDRIVSHIRAGHGFEPQSLAAWADMCSSGGTVLDIGAYSGLFSIAAAKMGCQAQAFEPMPLNAARTRANAKRNGTDISLFEGCVSDRAGPIDLTFNPNVVGMTAGASLVRHKGVRKSVASVTIDGLGLSQVTAIKIDVERAESFVLAGAGETLKRCRPVMLVEALGSAERATVEAAIPGYRVEAVLDVRNLLMVPC